MNDTLTREDHAIAARVTARVAVDYGLTVSSAQGWHAGSYWWADGKPVSGDELTRRAATVKGEVAR